MNPTSATLSAALPSGGPFKYDAFISYSHATDRALASALQRALHTLAKPWFRRPLLHVFRDESSLSASPALWPSIERALAASRWFVYLASPTAAASEWVHRELEWWLAHREPSSMLIVLTDGTIEWNDRDGDFDWTGSSAMPRLLAGRFAAEPLWVDLSWTRGKNDLNLRHSHFRDAILRLAAPLHGVPPDELEGEDVRQYRRTRRIAWSGVAALIALTLSSMVGAYIAVQRSRESRSRELAMQALQQLETDPELSVRLALHAVERAPTRQAEEALRRALTESGVIQTFDAPGPVWMVRYSPTGKGAVLVSEGDVLPIDERGNLRAPLKHPRPLSHAVFSADGQLLATACWDGKVRVWDMASSALRAELQASRQIPDEYSGRTIAQLAFSPDSRTLLTVGSDLIDLEDNGVVRVWDVATGARRLELRGHLDAISALAFDRQNTRIVTGSQDGAVRVWDAATGTLLRTMVGHDGEVTAAAFDEHGAVVSTGVDRRVVTWDSATGLARLNTDSASLGEDRDVSGRATWLLSPSARRAIRIEARRTSIYDPIGGRMVSELEDFPGSCESIVFSGDDRLVACAASDGTASVWESDSGVRVAQLRGHTLGLRDIAFSPDGRQVLTGSNDGTARTWSLDQGSTPIVLAGPGSDVDRATLSSDGRFAATGSGNGTVHLWSLTDGRRLWDASSPGFVRTMTFAADGRRLLVARSRQPYVQIVDVQTGAALQAVDVPFGPTTQEAGWSGDEAVLFVGVLDASAPNEAERAGATIVSNALAGLFARQRILRWDAQSGRSLPPLSGGRGYPLLPRASCGFSAAAGLACLGADDMSIARVWDLRTAQMVGEVKGRMEISVSAMSADGGLMALSDSTVVEIWGTKPTRLKATVRPPIAEAVSTLRFDATGARLATGGSERDPVVRLWDTSSGRLQRELRGHTRSVSTIVFSPDGEMLVTAAPDSRVHVWRLADGQPILTLRGHLRMVTDAHFLPDGRRLLTVGADGAVRIYDLSLATSLADLVTVARRRSIRPLTSEETTLYLQ